VRPGGNGARGQRRGAGESGREKSGGNGAPTYELRRHSAGRRGFKPDFKQNPNSNASNKFQTASNFG
jgi:hypothetical protein